MSPEKRSKKRSGSKSQDRPLEPVFFIDRCLGRHALVDELKRLRIEIKCVMHDDVFPQNTLDPEWMPQVAENGYVVLTRDKRIGWNRLELEVVARTGLCVFAVKCQKKTAGIAQMLSKALPKIGRYLAKKPAPFIAKIRYGNKKKGKDREFPIEVVDFKNRETLLGLLLGPARIRSAKKPRTRKPRRREVNESQGSLPYSEGMDV